MEMSAQDVMDTVVKDIRYYAQSGGGMTLSGGEPLAQFDFMMALLRLAKEKGIHTCVETSGYADTGKLLSSVPYVDLFLYDFKISDEGEHEKFTGVPLKPIMDNLFAIDEAGAKSILRCPIIPAFNERDGHFTAISALANALSNIVEVNIMPYHPMGASKAKRIGREYPIEDTGFQPDEQIDGWIRKIGQNTKVAVKRG
jgi:pyruvate formate lyase activating enzyme